MSTSPEQAAAPARRLSADVSALATGQAITWTMTALFTLVVPRALGPADLGVLVTATAVASILGVFLGLPTRDYVARELVLAPGDTARVLAAAVTLKLCLVPVFVAAALGYVALASPSATTRTAVLLCCAAGVLTLLAEPLLASFQAQQRMQYLAYVDVMTKTLQSLGGIAVVLLGGGVLGVSSFNLTVAALALLLAARWATRPSPLRGALRRVPALARASAPYSTFGVFYLVYLWVDQVLLGLLAPEQVVGWYGVATKLFSTMMFVPAVLSTAWFPRLVEAFRGGYDALLVAARAPVEAVLLLSLPICAGTAVLADSGIRLLYGSAYDGAAPALTVLALCLPLMYLSGMLNQVLIAARRPLAWTWLMAGATVVNPLVNLLLVRLTQDRWGNGAIGAAASLLVTELLVVGIGLRLVGRHLLDRRSCTRLLRALAATLVMAGAMHAAVPLGPVVAGVLGLVALGVAVAAFRVLAPEELAVVQRLGRRVAGPATRRVRGAARP